jgi:tight adherence protein C
MDTFFYQVIADPVTGRVAIVAFVALAVTAFALGVSSLVQGFYDPVRRRLGIAGEPAGEPMTVRVQSLLGPVARYVLPTRELERNHVRRRLAQAGFRSPQAMSTYYAVKLALAAVMLVGSVVLVGWLPQLQPIQVAVFCSTAACAGLFLPNVLLARFVDRRQRALRNGFPDALDLLVVCVEAGLGLAAALQRVSEELGVSHPELAGELAIVNAEMRAGIDREVALRNLADRTGLDDIRGLTSLLVQTLRFGTGIADALRVYADEFRDKRMQRAEELAAKVGTKLIFPLILCLFPGFFIVAIGPAVIRIVEAFGNGTL